MSDHLSIPKDLAYHIVNALRKGTPPEEGVDFYSVGREALISYFDKKLTEIKDHGISDVKFISADWGHGKSHFLDLLRELALKHNFVVSKVELHSREVPFDQLPVVVQRIMANITTPKDGKNGLEKLLNDWSLQNKGKNQQEIFESLKDIGIFTDMRLKLFEYQRHYNSTTGPEYQQCLQVMRWFEGNETRSRTFRDVREYLRSFVLLVRALEYSGFVVMLDEAEAITSLSRINRRDLANENIRQVIDNDNDTQGFFFIFASTPTFLSGEDERGAQSYPALWRRISDALPGLRQDSLHRVIIDLPQLTETEFFELANKIKVIYEIATSQSLTMVNDKHLRKLAHYVYDRTDKRVGTMVRSSVAILDEVTTNATDFDFLKRFELIVEGAMKQESYERAQ